MDFRSWFLALAYENASDGFPRVQVRYKTTTMYGRQDSSYIGMTTIGSFNEYLHKVPKTIFYLKNNLYHL